MRSFFRLDGVVVRMDCSDSSAAQQCQTDLSAKRLALRSFRGWPWLELAFFVFMAWYGWIWFKRISPWWFHPAWTTDDAVQQLYPLYKAIYPDIFRGDYITDMMERYLAPLHYWISFYLTKLTASPIMTGHWVMLIQLVLGLLFLALTVKRLAGWIPTFFALTWTLHSRLPIQRITGGLPRGWGFFVLAAGLYLMVAGHHRLILLLLLIGILLNPPATVIVAAAYGLLLLWRVYQKDSRSEYLPLLKRYLIAAPILAVIALSVTQMPKELGSMATLEEASSLPEFSTPYGRFPFVPLPNWIGEFKAYGLQSFISRLQGEKNVFRPHVIKAVLGILVVLLLASVLSRRVIVPIELWLFGFAALLVYFASREFAFRLYVPNRHLQLPGMVFFVTTFTVGIWHLCVRSEAKFLQKLGGSVALACLGVMIYFGSGSGLQGSMNFNYSLGQRSDERGRDAFQWIKGNTPAQAVIAGHPTFIDPVQLFSLRVAYVTSETAHPFFSKYREEMRRRLGIVLRAHYAGDWNDFLAALGDEKIDYFVFERRAFLPRARYSPPHDQLVKELLSTNRWAFGELPEALDREKWPFLVYIDGRSKIVDVAALRKYLAANSSGATLQRQPE